MKVLYNLLIGASLFLAGCAYPGGGYYGYPSAYQQNYQGCSSYDQYGRCHQNPLGYLLGQGQYNPSFSYYGKNFSYSSYGGLNMYHRNFSLSGRNVCFGDWGNRFCFSY